MCWHWSCALEQVLRAPIRVTEQTMTKGQRVVLVLQYDPLAVVTIQRLLSNGNSVDLQKTNCEEVCYLLKSERWKKGKKSLIS